ncbi:MAG: hypothetical protein ACFFDH_13560 [Promethearchaeota archaeon]
MSCRSIILGIIFGYLIFALFFAYKIDHIIDKNTEIMDKTNILMK